MEDRKYKGYFLGVVYPAFIEFIVDGIGIQKFNNLIGTGYTFDNKRGINPRIRKYFNQFLSFNPDMLKEVSDNNFKVFSPRNIAGGPLATPVECDNDDYMVQELLRPPKFELNQNVFRKSLADKRDFKEKKAKSGGLTSDRNPHRNSGDRQIPGTLFIQIKNVNHEKYFNTTHTYTIKEVDVKDVVNTFHEKDIITKIKFKGKDLQYEI